MSGRITENNANILFTAQKSDEKKKGKQASPRAAISTDNDMNDVYVSAKKKRGFIAKFYGLINKVIPLGLTDKKVQKKLIDYQEGKTTKKKPKIT